MLPLPNVATNRRIAYRLMLLVVGEEIRRADACPERVALAGPTWSAGVSGAKTVVATAPNQPQPTTTRSGHSGWSRQTLIRVWV
jgi:hypothetical protein